MSMMFVLASQSAILHGVIFYITATGGNIASTCDQFDYTLRYHDNIGNSSPEVGSHFYLDEALTIPYNGGSLYYTDDFGTSYRINLTGEVTVVVAGNCIVM